MLLSVRDGDWMEIHLAEVPAGAATRDYGYECLLERHLYVRIPCGRYIKLARDLDLHPSDALTLIEIAGLNVTWIDEHGKHIPPLEVR